MANNAQKLEAVTRTSEGLRAALLDEIDLIRDGSGNEKRANAVARLASGVVETVQLELNAHNAVGVNAPPGALLLG